MRGEIYVLTSRLAWRVDFNVALPSFEPLLAGARNILDLALSSPIPGGPRALFVSSISSLRSTCYHDLTMSAVLTSCHRPPGAYPCRRDH